MQKRLYILKERQLDLIMNIQLEKSNIIKRLQQINDESLLQAVKSLLDYAQKNVEQPLEASIDKGLAESAQGQGRPHTKVMGDLREKYKE